MFTLVCYDTPSARRRRRIARAVLGFVSRVQKSVYEGELDPPQLRVLLERIQKVVDIHQDSVRIYQLPRDALRDVHLFGAPPLSLPEAVYWVGPPSEDTDDPR